MRIILYIFNANEFIMAPIQVKMAANTSIETIYSIWIILEEGDVIFKDDVLYLIYTYHSNDALKHMQNQSRIGCDY